ncbi:MAG: hypothetical protein ACYDBB_00535 [Armatimonadota bacterium]
MIHCNTRHRDPTRFIILALLLAIVAPSFAVSDTPTKRQQQAYRIGYYLDCGISPFLAIASEMKQIDAAEKSGRLTHTQRNEMLEKLVPMARSATVQNQNYYQWVAETLRADFNFTDKSLAPLITQNAVLKKGPRTPDDDDVKVLGADYALLGAYLTMASANLKVSSAIEEQLMPLLARDERWYYQMGSMIPFITETMRNELFDDDLQNALATLVKSRPADLPVTLDAPLNKVAKFLPDGIARKDRGQVMGLLNVFHQTIVPDAGKFHTDRHLVTWPAGADYVPSNWGQEPGVLA